MQAIEDVQPFDKLPMRVVFVVREIDVPAPIEYIKVSSYRAVAVRTNKNRFFFTSRETECLLIRICL